MPSDTPLLLSIHIRLRIDRVTKRRTKFAKAQITLNISDNPVEKKKLIISKLTYQSSLFTYKMRRENNNKW